MVLASKKKMDYSIPNHIGIIMDGNGRWAVQRGLPRVEGHKKGAESVDDVVQTARRIGVKYLTLYAFSKDNWKRPPDEVRELMRLLKKYLVKERRRMKENSIKFQVVGDIDDLPADIKAEIKKTEEFTKDCKDMVLTLALSYSGRKEIVKAVKKVVRMCKRNQIDEKMIDEKLITEILGLPDVDLLIRTSGEMRISDFLLWHISYAEIYITKKLWPDFRGKDLIRAIKWFSKRERRFGMTSEQLRSSSG